MACDTCGRDACFTDGWGYIEFTAVHPDCRCEHLSAMRYCRSCSEWWHRDGMEPDWDIDGCAHEDCPSCKAFAAEDERADLETKLAAAMEGNE